MAVELEQTVMNEIGFGQHYSYWNGSGSCDYARKQAVDKLQEKARANGLSISPEWLARCREACRVDAVDGGRYTLTNTWISCSYAIQDAIYRKEGGKGFAPDGTEWHFWNDEKRKQWEARSGRFDGLEIMGYSRR